MANMLRINMLACSSKHHSSTASQSCSLAIDLLSCLAFFWSTKVKTSFLIFLAGLPRLCAALVNYHAGLHSEAAESLVAAPGLHAQKPRCSTTAITAVSATAAAMHPQR